MITHRPPIRRVTRVRSRRARPRRGRIYNPEFMMFARAQGCILREKHECVGPVSFHHLRTFGSSKDDTCGVPLCYAGHLYEFGEFSIERLGKLKFQRHWHVSLKAEVEKLRKAYRDELVNC